MSTLDELRDALLATVSEVVQAAEVVGTWSLIESLNREIGLALDAYRAAAQQEARAGLVAALEKYGAHLEGCSCNPQWHGYLNRPCDCGLREVLTTLAARDTADAGGSVEREGWRAKEDAYWDAYRTTPPSPAPEVER